MLSVNTRGRKTAVKPCEIRTDFQRDRDRILHSKSFRRLMNKTQVFLSPKSDHYRTRLTHTLEVSQVARTIARALLINEDLVEAIALGHDLGHTPFGHTGEDILSEICPHGFKHSEQSVRILETLENLNVTYEVRDGIRCHSGGEEAQTLEGQIVRYADKIAYMNHDIEDAVRAGILSEEDIPFNIRHKVGRTKSQRITAFITNLVENTEKHAEFDSEFKLFYNELRDFMFSAVYTNPIAKGEEKKAQHIIAELYRYFMKSPDLLTEEYRNIMEKEGKDRAVCDYIAGMSDKYAITKYQDLFLPKSWRVEG